MDMPHRSRLTAAVTAIAFAILVSVAASHLHVGHDAEDGCAVCAAFAGKLEGSSAKVVVPKPSVVEFLSTPVSETPQLAHSIVVVLPPGRGPPPAA
jgi:predicted neuraminidase